MTEDDKPSRGDAGPRKPLRVAYFASHPASIGSGCERLIYNSATGLMARGHDAQVYVKNLYWDRTPPVFVRQLPLLPGEDSLERWLAGTTGWNDIFLPSTALMRLAGWIRSADIWHFHNLHAHYVSIPLLGLVSRTKRVVISPVDQYLTTGHCTYPLECEMYLTGCGPCPRPEEPFPGISRDSTRALWRMKRSFIRLGKAHWLFHTRYLQGRYEEALGRPIGKVIHYGVDLDCFRPAPPDECARRLQVEKPTRFTVGLLHSHLLEPRKGILPIIERLGEMAKRAPGRFGLLVVGYGSERVKDAVPQELSLTALPFLRQQNELADALNLCDVLLYPTKAENLSLTCLSALACGVPVISYDVGGQGEAVTDGANGFLVPPGDHEAMLGAMARMADDPALLRRLKEGARASAVEKFDLERYIDELLMYYYGILGRQ